MEEYRKIFNQYFKRFDIKEKHILGKFHHSYRVSGYCEDIGEFLKLNKHDIELCKIIGLFHDIGRFEQWTKYQTFWDKDSIDHADLTYEIIEKENILKNMDVEDENTIMTAIKYHNKYDIKEVTNEKIALFCKIIRDADKIDIMLEQLNKPNKIEEKLSKKIVKVLYEKRICPNEYVITSVDNILRHIGFIFDLNFTYSLKILKEKNWVNNQFNLLENYVEDKNIVQELKEFIDKYVEERIEC